MISYIFTFDLVCFERDMTIILVAKLSMHGKLSLVRQVADDMTAILLFMILATETTQQTYSMGKRP